MAMGSSQVPKSGGSVGKKGLGSNDPYGPGKKPGGK